MRNSKAFRTLARQRLKGKWGISVLVTFVASLLGGTSSGGGGSSAGSSVSNAVDADGAFSSEVTAFFSNPAVISALIGIITIAALVGIALFVIGAAVELGHCRYYIGLMGGESPEFGILFSRFHIFLKALGLRLYMGLFIFLWSLLFIIPGIIAAYRYAMAPYLMAQYPEKGIVECVQDSKALMNGHKG
ncbi:MAG: DUF975 family protein, partial [Candidatus Pelethousia sp.]|nr:DUF975 family protein [Candidatus Pelethousia sp.]